VADRHRVRNLFSLLYELEDDQLVGLGDLVLAEIRKRNLDRERIEAEEARRALGIFLNLDAFFTLTFYRVTGRGVNPKAGFAPLLARFPGQRSWHLIEPDTGRGITFPVKRESVKLACRPTPTEVAGIAYRTGQTECALCYGSGKIVVAITRPPEPPAPERDWSFGGIPPLRDQPRLGFEPQPPGALGPHDFGPDSFGGSDY
jgi:hypothetical protein